MRIVKFNRFTRPGLLQGIGRELLEEFFTRFAKELGNTGVSLPGRELPDAAYCNAMADVLSRPEKLPPGLIEALVAIDEMSGPDGQERLQRASEQAGLQLSPTNGSTRPDLALRLWLANPSLLIRKHNEHRLERLTVFEYFAPATPQPSAPVCSLGPEDLARLEAGLDAWFDRSHRGRNTTRVQVQSIHDELWFVVRHGDTFTRMPAVQEQQTDILHFRPERDDVVIYSPASGELRVNARTRSERELYVRAFGDLLHKDPRWFSRHFLFTLEPLRELGPDALNPRALESVNSITLREVKLRKDLVLGDTLTREAADLFRAGAEGGWNWRELPGHWGLVSARLDFRIHGDAKPRPVQIRLPNVLKVGRHGDAGLVIEWMRRAGFWRKT